MPHAIVPGPTLQRETFRRSVAVLLAALGLFVLASCRATPASGDSANSPSPPAQQATNHATGHDWTRFGWDASRSNASADETGITASNVATLRRQQVTIDGTVDSSPIYLHGVSINGRARDVFFVTTTYGKTLAIDANDGSVLWRYTPPGFDRWAGSRQITTATPVADPNRGFIYAASPDGRILKLAVADGHSVWSTAITLLPAREKIASSLNFDRGHVIAVTGGYIGDAPPYQGHVAILDAASGRILHVWNSLCSSSDGLMQPSSCNESGSAIWGRAGAVIDSGTGDMFFATGNATWDGQTNWGDAAIALDANAKMLDNYAPANTLELRVVISSRRPLCGIQDRQLCFSPPTMAARRPGLSRAVVCARCGVTGLEERAPFWPADYYMYTTSGAGSTSTSRQPEKKLRFSSVGAATGTVRLSSMEESRCRKEMPTDIMTPMC